MTIRAGVVLALLLLLYVFAFPLWLNRASGFVTNRFVDLQHATAYYQVASNVAGVVTGLAGLALGYRYFALRNRFDRSQSERAALRHSAQVLAGELSRYDSLVARVLSVSVENEAELNLVRHQIDTCFDNIAAALECLECESEPIKQLVHLHSFVEKSDLIMDFSIDELRAGRVGRSADRRVYLGRLEAARRAVHGIVPKHAARGAESV